MIARRMAFVVASSALLAACAAEGRPEGTWTVDHVESQGAVLSVWGSGPDDLWAVGGQEDSALVLHNDGSGWTRTDVFGDRLLTLTYGFHAADVYAVGDGGLILHYDGASWKQVESSTDRDLYGLWGASGDEVWAVGGDLSQHGSAVILRGDASGFEVVSDLPTEMLPSALFKVYGSGDEIIAVGTGGTILRYDGSSWQRDQVPTTQTIFSLWGRDSDDLYAVAGSGSGEILHYDGSAWNSLQVKGGLSGIFTAPNQPLIAVGMDSYVVEIGLDGQMLEPELPDLRPAPWLHSVWGDGHGTAYAAGGDLLAYPQPMSGVILRRE